MASSDIFVRIGEKLVEKNPHLQVALSVGRLHRKHSYDCVLAGLEKSLPQRLLLAFHSCPNHTSCRSNHFGLHDNENIAIAIVAFAVCHSGSRSNVVVGE